jgi:uroporphyrinogen decarboxylase
MPISHRDRIEVCLSGESPDRPPVAFWRHFPVDDQTPEGLASATIAYQNQFDFDLVKVSPSSSFCIKDWGAEDVWNGAIEGTRDYTKRVVQRVEDLGSLSVLNPDEGNLGKQISCLRLLFNEFGSETPILQTIFNPLSQMKNLVGKENLLSMMRQNPETFEAGLEVITQSILRFMEEIKLTGIAGIFYAVQHGQHGILSTTEFERFSKPYDLRILESASDMWLNMLHIHGVGVMFDQFLDYPVQIFNWHDRETEPELNLGRHKVAGIVCGGLNRYSTLVLGTADDVKAEAMQALKMCEGNRVILGTGCVSPLNVPFGNLMAARNVVEEFSM